MQSKHVVLSSVFLAAAWMCSSASEELSLDEQLLTATLSGDMAQVRRLVEAGADVNAESAVAGMSEEDFRQAGLHGATPLFIAAHGGNVEIAELLVDAGANLNTKSGAETPLMAAAFLGHLQIVNLLIERGADVAINSSQGNAVNYAVAGGHLEVVRLLLDAGGYKPATLNGLMAMSAAKTNGHAEIESLLQTEQDRYMESGAAVKGIVDRIRKRAAEDPANEQNRILLELMDRLESVDITGASDGTEGARAVSQARVRQIGDRFRDCSECPEMIVLPAGEFDMGSGPQDDDRSDWEGPVHRVTVETPIAMGLNEVTVGEFRRFVAHTGHSAGDSCWTFEAESLDELLQREDFSTSETQLLVLYGGHGKDRKERGWRNPGFRQDDEHPAVCVSWDDARAYAKWLSEYTGQSYRLPSEAQWEYAARAGTTTTAYWGDMSSDRCRYANGPELDACEDGHRHSAPVGAYLPNGFGLYDMLGNAGEWTADCAYASYQGAPVNGAAREGGDCSLRPVRGGAYQVLSESHLRSAARNFIPQGSRAANIGFRVVRSMRMEMHEEVARTDENSIEDSELAVGQYFRDCANCPAMVPVAAGSFEMGSTRREEGRSRVEGPVHEVTIAGRFAVGVHEVTQGEFDEFVAATGHTRPGDCFLPEFGPTRTAVSDGWDGQGTVWIPDSHPVVCVNWHDATAYAEWLSGKTGKNYRLPSESEWEFAARGGSGAARHWRPESGERSKNEAWSGQCAHANGADRSFRDMLVGSVQDTPASRSVIGNLSRSFVTCEDWHTGIAPVGSYRPNGFGLFDTIGNVSEWTMDCWNRNYRRAPRDGQAWTEGDCGLRVVRGGAFASGAQELRSAHRMSVRSDDRFLSMGFRVVRSLHEIREQ
ncbi:MAG: SUMF1/EgtB/PvdO family nonheme iron enzyme [Chloroflexota bacterium]|nr:SUMF1/EgtB/PvdO family nonheme iron enzyme [Chloroflexota bacterium]